MKTIQKIVKTYICIEDLHLSTEVVDRNKNVHRISFQNGIKTPVRLNGRYTTDSELIQEAVETDPFYGIKFELHGEGTVEVIVGGKEVKAPVITKANPIDESKLEAVEDVFGIQEAREYLKEKFPDVEDAELSNIDKVIGFAVANGLNLVNIRKKRE